MALTIIVPDKLDKGETQLIAALQDYGAFLVSVNEWRCDKNLNPSEFIAELKKCLPNGWGYLADQIKVNLYRH